MINDELDRRGLPRRFTEAELDAAVRAGFRRVAAPRIDRVELPQQTGGEARTTRGSSASTTTGSSCRCRRAGHGQPVGHHHAAGPGRGRDQDHLARPGPRRGAQPAAGVGRIAAELMLGSLPQGGTSAVRAPCGPLRAAAGPSRGHRPGRGDPGRHVARRARAGHPQGPDQLLALASTVRSASAGSYSLGGGVADNRGESTLYEVVTQWRLAIRVGEGRDGFGKWQEFGRVGGPDGTGTTGDYSDPAGRPTSATSGCRTPTTRAVRPQGSRPRPRGHDLPAYAPIWVGDWRGWSTRCRPSSPSATRHRRIHPRQLRAFLVSELGGRLDVAHEGGLQLLLSDRLGRPMAHLEVTATPCWTASAWSAGRASRSCWRTCNVWFSSTSQGATTSSGRTSTRAAAVELANQALDAAEGFGRAPAPPVAVDGPVQRHGQLADGDPAGRAPPGRALPGVRHPLGVHGADPAPAPDGRGGLRRGDGQHHRRRAGAHRRARRVPLRPPGLPRRGERTRRREGRPRRAEQVRPPPAALAPKNLGNGKRQMRSVGHAWSGTSPGPRCCACSRPSRSACASCS
jgi:hypothetical protein